MAVFVHDHPMTLFAPTSGASQQVLVELEAAAKPVKWVVTCPRKEVA